MQDVLKTLLELQGVDQKIFDIDKSKTDLPERIKLLKNEIEDTQSDLKGKEQQIKDLQSEQRKFEQDITTANDFLKKSQDRLSMVKNNREYDALQEEIDVQREKISESETEIIRIMNSVEEFQKKREEKKNDFGELKKTHLDEIKKLEDILKSIEDKRAEQENSRKKIVVSVENKVLRVYERVRKGNRNGIAVAQVKRGACSGCYRKIPPQDIVEIRKNDKLHLCESCGRMLVWAGEK